jgi:hypothetical protein
MLADSNNILNRWEISSFQMFNVLVRGVQGVRQREIHTIEPLVPEPSLFEVEVAITKLKRCEYKSPNIDQSTAELIQAGGELLGSEIH